MSEQDLWKLTLELTPAHRTLLDITGERSTVVEAALRVMLDCAPAWNEYQGYRPVFTMDCFRIKA